jgi:predicted transcriptional regulator
MISDFLTAKLSSEKINTTQMAKKIGVTQSAISHFLSRRRFPSGHALIKILRAYPDLAEVLLK